MKKTKMSVLLLFVISLVLFSCSKDNIVRDYDGNVYKTVQIGDQLWMAENLKVTHYRNGDPIPHLTDDDGWKSTSSGAYCVYDNNPSNADTYGNLYNWYAVDDSRNIAPEGWHVPTDEEIMELEMELGMSQSQANITGFRGTNEGSKLAGGYKLWSSGDLRNDPEFDTSGFSFLPGGCRDYNIGDDDGMAGHGCFWSSSESGASAWYRHLHSNSTVVIRLNANKRSGFSVRCVKDDTGSKDNTVRDYDGNVYQTVQSSKDDTGSKDNTVIKDSTVSDYDGNVYQTVQIGDQLWMAENLKVTHYRNGDAIPHVTDFFEWGTIKTGRGAYCVYDKNPSNAKTYGNLYNWWAVVDPRGLAPEGWHVPTDDEITQLTDFLGDNAGSKLAGGYDLWWDGDLRNNSDFDTSGFSFLPGGFRGGKDGFFDAMGGNGVIWSSEEYFGYAMYQSLSYSSTTVKRGHFSKGFGFSVRFVRD